jgi:hypothetical protein
MRKLSDKGMAPNSRFYYGQKNLLLALSPGQLIRLFADYNKTIIVRQSMLRIEINGEYNFYTLWNKELVHQLNGCHVKVRLIKRNPDYAYLYDPTSDTYLGSVRRSLEVAGDKANATKQDVNQIMAFAQKKKGLKNYRKDLLKNIVSEINEDNKELPLPDSLTEENRLIIDEKFLNDTNDDNNDEVSDEKFSNLNQNETEDRPVLEVVSNNSTQETPSKLEPIDL